MSDDLNPQASAGLTPTTRSGDPEPIGASASADEIRTFEDGAGPDDTPLRHATPNRPQADFGQPISVDPKALQAASPIAADGEAAPTVSGGEVPPLYADADDAAEPRLAEQRPAPELTVRIVQGRPSYSEPQPEIAGVVGKAARGALPDEEASVPPNPRDGGVT